MSPMNGKGSPCISCHRVYGEVTARSIRSLRIHAQNKSLTEWPSTGVSWPRVNILLGFSSLPVSRQVNKPRGLQWVVDVTIAYPNARPMDIQTWIFGYRPPTVTHVHYRISEVALWYTCDV
ncbi:hypothetical protein JZ751_010327 [Albula glossodonta]|uniref:Uncharacterized protein n=1 Tax=Albula glossodonta TaxID=121402 RepID=A0A8T2P4V7_9TELE|nr:hypothetical protein JZ751_010327 [Albula glossodonta]